jgi:hypothetical protein
MQKGYNGSRYPKWNLFFNDLVVHSKIHRHLPQSTLFRNKRTVNINVSPFLDLASSH